jgi:transposase InsO family protein
VATEESGADRKIPSARFRWPSPPVAWLRSTPSSSGTLKGVGKAYLQTAIDCHSRYAWARLYPSKLPVTAVHLVNNDVIPAFERYAAKIDTVLSDNGREFCGRPDQHPYELFLQHKEIEHRTIRVKRPQSNGIVKRLHQDCTPFRHCSFFFHLRRDPGVCASPKFTHHIDQPNLEGRGPNGS